jgi:hypothetical protein
VNNLETVADRGKESRDHALIVSWVLAFEWNCFLHWVGAGAPLYRPNRTLMINSRMARVRRKVLNY